MTMTREIQAYIFEGADALDSAPLTPDAARVLTDEVKSDAQALWMKLLRLYTGGAHTALGFSSWADFCAAEFDLGRSRSYQLLQSARVAEAVQQVGLPTPRTDRVARELLPLQDDPERLRETWAKTVEEHGTEPTAEQVRKAVRPPRYSKRAYEGVAYGIEMTHIFGDGRWREQLARVVPRASDEDLQHWIKMLRIGQGTIGTTRDFLERTLQERSRARVDEDVRRRAHEEGER